MPQAALSSGQPWPISRLGPCWPAVQALLSTQMTTRSTRSFRFAYWYRSKVAACAIESTRRAVGAANLVRSAHSAAAFQRPITYVESKACTAGQHGPRGTAPGISGADSTCVSPLWPNLGGPRFRHGPITLAMSSRVAVSGSQN